MPMSASVPVTRSLVRRLAPVLIAGMILFGSTAGADASNSYNNTTTIYACVNKVTKAVRIVLPRNGHSACPTRERLVTWSKVTGVTSVSPMGPMGPQGPQGLAGTARAPGAAGAAGADGAAGAAGADGAQGPAGADGAQGPAGADGAPGADGAQGPAGADGAQGPAGADGAPGPQGPDGADGAPGPQGPAGPAGADGATGAKGATGDTGPQGPAGPAGGLSSVTRVTGTAAGFAGNDVLGATVTGTATCASGKLVGGGGDVNGNNAKKYAAITSSYPSSATVWTVTATLVAGSFANGSPPSLTPYALCAA